MKPIVLLLLFLGIMIAPTEAQENVPYQKPSQEILDLVDVPRAPGVLIDYSQSYMILLYRNAYKSISELSEKEMRLGGLRINPKTHIGSRVTYYNQVAIRNLQTGEEEATPLAGLPENPQLANLTWSPDQKKIACTHTTESGVELWVVDLETKQATRLTEPVLNAVAGSTVSWIDQENLLVKVLPADREALIDAESTVPIGPTISENEGKKAQNRTYQDLLANKVDEHNFEQLMRSELHKVNLSGDMELWMASDMYRVVSFSPNREYIMISKVEKPFSYLVPYSRFPSSIDVFTTDAQKVQTLIEVPLIEDLPKGFMAVRQGKRSFEWRADRPATLVYVEALDKGDPAEEVEYRDEVFELEAPFSGEGSSILKTKNRFRQIIWGTDKMAIAYDLWWNTRNLKTYRFDPSDVSTPAEVINDRNYQDRYSNPGSFVTSRNEWGRYTLATEKNEVYLMGAGYTEKGQFPFVDKLNIKTLEKERIYESTYTDKLESLSRFKPDKQELLVRIEASSEYPNYYFRNLKTGKLTQLTDFDNPFESIQNVHKEVISYKREDGLELSGTLYLPVGYDMEEKEKVPMILWAYPREYKDKQSAGQNTQNPNEFTYPYYGSPVFWVAKGYAVLDDAAFPIVGEGDEEPNDSFRRQLVSNAKAAIDAVDAMGYIDRNRVGVGGHSYGAFMVANLLSHSDLFAAGIARSGAYNRTLTPFGFQSEERNYWEAPEVYYTMSPFMHAEKMKTPLLLVHGEADNNSGTYPLQSKRYFNALKGLGATVRLVMLPNESHGYRAKESIMHLLWEQDQWLEKYVKNREVAGVQEIKAGAGSR
ncbi:MAG: prolyl oligopeptidase family serine peptidase [Bacteroidota bacterium]